MGMFDYIKNELFCCYCGARQKERSFQTKDFQKAMIDIDILKVRGVNYRIYTNCPNCDNWIDLSINEQGIQTINTGKKRIKKKQVELAKLFKRRVG